MKKCTKTLALLAAAALLSGGLFLSCANSDDEEEQQQEQQNNNNESENSSESENTSEAETKVTVNAAWDFTENARDGSAVDGISATKGGAQPTSAIELTTNKTGSGATMTVLTNTKCEWNSKLQYSTGQNEYDLFTITTDEACTAVIKVASSSGTKTSGKINALKLGSTTIYDFDSVDTKDAAEKTVSLSKGANTFSGSGVSIYTVTLSN